MKYMKEIAVLALLVIAATSVYRIVHHRHHCNKQDNVQIQAFGPAGRNNAIGTSNGTSPARR